MHARSGTGRRAGQLALLANPNIYEAGGEPNLLDVLFSEGLKCIL
jgi:hypothetical protein